MSKPVLRFFPSFECWPLWWSHDDGGVENPDPRDADLGLPAALAAAVATWSDDYDARFDQDDFSKPLFTDPAEEAAFSARGLDLARQVAAAVGDRWTVRYEDLATGEKTDLS